MLRKLAWELPYVWSHFRLELHGHLRLKAPPTPTLLSPGPVGSSPLWWPIQRERRQQFGKGREAPGFPPAQTPSALGSFASLGGPRPHCCGPSDPRASSLPLWSPASPGFNLPPQVTSVRWSPWHVTYPWHGLHRPCRLLPSSSLSGWGALCFG